MNELQQLQQQFSNTLKAKQTEWEEQHQQIENEFAAFKLQSESQLHALQIQIEQDKLQKGKTENEQIRSLEDKLKATQHERDEIKACILAEFEKTEQKHAKELQTVKKDHEGDVKKLTSELQAANERTVHLQQLIANMKVELEKKENEIKIERSKPQSLTSPKVALSSKEKEKLQLAPNNNNNSGNKETNLTLTANRRAPTPASAAATSIASTNEDNKRAAKKLENQSSKHKEIQAKENSNVNNKTKVEKTSEEANFPNVAKSKVLDKSGGNISQSSDDDNKSFPLVTNKKAEEEDPISEKFTSEPSILNQRQVVDDQKIEEFALESGSPQILANEKSSPLTSDSSYNENSARGSSNKVRKSLKKKEITKHLQCFPKMMQNNKWK